MTTMAERTCSFQTNTENAQKCRDKNGQRLYGPVWVEIYNVDAASDTVVFLAKGCDTGIHKYAISWKGHEMWAPCPSSLDSPDNGYPAVEQQGFLYLEDQYITRNRIAFVGTPKWPDRALANVPTRELAVWPTRLVGSFVELVSGKYIEKEIDLLDPYWADDSQELVLRPGASASIRLTANGFARFYLAFPTIDDLDNAVKIIEHPVDARRVADAWQQVAGWQAVLENGGSDTPPTERARAQQLINRALGR
jgi:hypothetical protein